MSLSLSACLYESVSSLEVEKEEAEDEYGDADEEAQVERERSCAAVIYIFALSSDFLPRQHSSPHIHAAISAAKQRNKYCS